MKKYICDGCQGDASQADDDWDFVGQSGSGDCGYVEHYLCPDCKDAIAGKDAEAKIIRIEQHIKALEKLDYEPLPRIEALENLAQDLMCIVNHLLGTTDTPKGCDPECDRLIREEAGQLLSEYLDDGEWIGGFGEKALVTHSDYPVGGYC